MFRLGTSVQENSDPWSKTEISTYPWSREYIRFDWLFQPMLNLIYSRPRTRYGIPTWCHQCINICWYICWHRKSIWSITLILMSIEKHLVNLPIFTWCWISFVAIFEYGVLPKVRISHIKTPKLQISVSLVNELAFEFWNISLGCKSWPTHGQDSWSKAEKWVKLTLSS